MENNGSKKIFFAIVGVAAIITAIMGATFAYFLISVSGTNSVTATSLAVAGKLAISEDTSGRKTNLIPVTDAIALSSYNQTGTGNKAKCVGVAANNTSTTYNLCSVYTFTVTNSASVAQSVRIKLTTVANTFYSMKYCVFTGAATTATGSCALVPAAGASNAVTLIDRVSLAATNGSATYSIMLYVMERSANQTTSDSNKSYTGRVDITTDSGANLTGIISS